MINYNHTAVFFRTGHKALWMWRSRHLTKSQWDWPGWSTNGGRCAPTHQYSFACAACKCCADCPIYDPILQREADAMDCLGGIFGSFVDAVTVKDWKLARETALQIRDLPVRQGTNCK